MDIVIIGAGRVGTAMSIALSEKGHKILKVISRSDKKAGDLAKRLNSDYSNDLVLPGGTELVIIAVNDSSISSVIDDIRPKGNELVVHTAGSVGIDIFKGNYKNYGVLYPLQTFTIGRKYDFSTIPLFIETNDDRSFGLLKSFAGGISGRVYRLNSNDRRYLHLSAVFASNFVNHMFTAGKDLSEMAGLEFDVLVPLIRETLAKASEIGPDKSQTGPAVRNDKKTIEKHLDLLSFSPGLKEMYRVITDSIVKKYTG